MLRVLRSLPLFSREVLFPVLKIQKVILALGDYMGATCLQADAPHIGVGKPRRVFDILNRRYLSPKWIQMFVLDKADKTLSHGFKDQIYEIFQKLNVSIQVVLLSTIMPTNVLEVTKKKKKKKKFMRDLIPILVKKEKLTLEGIKQFYVNVEKEEWKLDTLCDLYKTLTIIKCMPETSQFLLWFINLQHDDMDQRERDVMREFRSGSSRVLTATDLLTLGTDVQEVSLGRLGRKGVAINFVTKEDKRILCDTETFYNTTVEEMPMNVADLI
uniref:Helicase ATP-binding domain-containing protein n=1 Tax=Saimiri boliviensis boliviensis TaxID=39432 RepID=A0A2K6T7N2_SAIBB